MSEADPGTSGNSPGLDVPPEVFVSRLENYERVLLQLKELLYEGSWDRIHDDLRARLDNKPYMFKLSQAINRDMAAIERLKAYEEKHAVDLGQLAKKFKADQA